ncbi:hypothetical protein F4781DRAFT_407651 [Annulohypoxylon bovei var. microspora]|nr:hypothetical protein F4781DRAFT_407651 [Annulohypoxylon bovei var. microspora]
MTSYTSREHDTLPGSFPADDTLPTSVEQSNLASTTSHPYHNKLHKREDPRGWVDQGKTTRGHQYTDSGVGLTESGTFNQQVRSRANEGAFHSNKTVLQRHAGSNTASGTAAAGLTDHRGSDRKPGVMTGAYSRLDDRDNLDYPKLNPQESTKEQASATKSVVNPASGTAASVTPEAESKLGNGNRNIVRNDPRQSSDLEHDDPYWGDVPYGAGTYNTVAGHGSSETPADGSVHPHGRQLSHEQQQLFPLSLNDNTSHGEPGDHDSSRLKEGIAAGTGAGLVASKLPDKQHDQHHKKEDLEKSTSHKDDDKGTSTGSKIVSFFYRDHKEKDVKPEKKHEAKEESHSKQRAPSKDDSPLTNRDAGAALAAAPMAHGIKDNAHKHEKNPVETERRLKDSKTNALYENPNEKIDNRFKETKGPFMATGYSGPHSQSTAKNTNETYPVSDSMTSRNNLSTSQTAIPVEQKDSKLGHGLEAASLGAGAGYAIHEHVNRDNKHKGQSIQPAYENPTMMAPKTPSGQPMHSSHVDDKSRLGTTMGNTAPTASLAKEHTMPQAGSDAKSTHTDPSHHQYYLLSDGTPSGMKISDHSGTQANATSSSPSAARNTVTGDSHTGAKIAAAGASVAGAGAAAHHVDKQNNDKNAASGTRKAAGFGSSEDHEPHMESTGTRGLAPVDASHNGVMRDNTFLSNTPHDHYGAKNVLSSPPTTTAPSTTKDSHHTEAKAATAAAGAAGAGAAAKHHNKKDSDSNIPVSTTARDHRSATTSTPHALHSAQNTAPKSHTRNRASTDSSHGGQYNVLASGTPSGINVGDRDHLGRKSLDGANASKTPAGAFHPAAMDTGAASKRDVGSTGVVAGAGAGAGAGMAAVAASALKAGDRVVHRCGTCGEENDITGYFHE